MRQLLRVGFIIFRVISSLLKFKSSMTNLAAGIAFGFIVGYLLAKVTNTPQDTSPDGYIMGYDAGVIKDRTEIQHLIVDSREKKFIPITKHQALNYRAVLKSLNPAYEVEAKREPATLLHDNTWQYNEGENNG